MDPLIEIALADPSAPDITPLIAANLAHSAADTPEGSRHALGPVGLSGDGIRFWVLRENGRPVGCGALKALGDGTSEVKSVFVLDEARGRGLAGRIMAHLETLARQEGCPALVLETGSPLLPGYGPARALYEGRGYRLRDDPIPGYPRDPNSAHYEKRLD